MDTDSIEYWSLVFLWLLITKRIFSGNVRLSFSIHFDLDSGPDNFSQSGGTVYYLLLSEIPQPENNLILVETNY
jgi:hypothetical protein